MADGQMPKVKEAPPRFVYSEGSIPSAHAAFSKPPLHPFDPKFKVLEKPEKKAFVRKAKPMKAEGE